MRSDFMCRRGYHGYHQIDLTEITEYSSVLDRTIATPTEVLALGKRWSSSPLLGPAIVKGVHPPGKLRSERTRLEYILVRAPS